MNLYSTNTNLWLTGWLYSVQTKQRPDWDQYFNQIAKAVAERASCPRAKVGAVIVSNDNRILSTGYNGALRGERACYTYGCVIVDAHCQRAIHAEINAVAYAARVGVPLAGSRLYIYSSRGDTTPCRECQKVLSATNIHWS